MKENIASKVHTSPADSQRTNTDEELEVKNQGNILLQGRLAFNGCYGTSADGNTRNSCYGTSSHGNTRISLQYIDVT